MTEKTELEQGNEIEIPPEGLTFDYRGYCTAEIKPAGGNNIAVNIRYKNDGEGTPPKTYDISTLPHQILTIGRLSGNDISLTASANIGPNLQGKYKMISGLQAEIRKEGDRIFYKHLGRYKIHNPLSGPIEPEKAVINPKRGSGAGFSDRNGNASNEDCAIAHQFPVPETPGYLGISDSEAITSLSSLFSDHIIPNTRNMPGGSTLSMAMRTREDRFVCAHVGDSPIFLIMQDPESKRIELVQVGLEHNKIGEDIRTALFPDKPALTKAGIMEQLRQPVVDRGLPEDGLREINRVALLAKLEAMLSPLTKSLVMNATINREDSKLSKNLGRMKKSAPLDIEYQEPDINTIVPAELCPGKTCKGILICSDGINEGITNGKVQNALQTLYDAKPSPTPAEVSKAAVEAGMDHADAMDNITAMMLPFDAAPGELIAVADGNTDTAAVAKKAIECIREQCQERDRKSGGFAGKLREKLKNAWSDDRGTSFEF